MNRPPRHFLLQAYAIIVCCCICGLLLLAAYSESSTGRYAVVASLTGSRSPETNTSLAIEGRHLATNAITSANVSATQLNVARASPAPFVEHSSRYSLNRTLDGNASSVDRQSILKSLAQANYHRLTHQFAKSGSPLECGVAPFLAVVVVQCLPRHSLRRALIRQTWATQAQSAGFKVIFLLGHECFGDSSDDALSAEAAEHGDLLIADFCEHYLNLTLKTLLMIEWASAHCAAASYLVKIDSDVYLHVRRLRELLLLPKTKPASVASSVPGSGDGAGIVTRRREIIGKLAVRHVPSRSPLSKWYMPYDLFDGLYYPQFVYGPCYALSIDLLADIAGACNRRPYLPYEDVFVTGMCSEKLSAVTRRGYENFIANRCGSRVAVAVHWYSCWQDRPIELRLLFANESASRTAPAASLKANKL